MAVPTTRKEDIKQFVGHFISCLLDNQSFARILEQQDHKMSKLVGPLKTAIHDKGQGKLVDGKKIVTVVSKQQKIKLEGTDWLSWTKILMYALCTEMNRSFAGIFTVNMRSLSRCQKCQQETKLSDESCYHLTINSESTAKYLSTLMEKHTRKSEDQYCPSCKCTTVYSAKTFLETFPDVLTIVLTPSTQVLIQHSSTKVVLPPIGQSKSKRFSTSLTISPIGNGQARLQLEELLHLETIFSMPENHCDDKLTYRLQGVIFQSTRSNSFAALSKNSRKSTSTWNYISGTRYYPTKSLENFEQSWGKTTGDPCVFFYSKESQGIKKPRTSKDDQTMQVEKCRQPDQIDISIIKCVLEALYLCDRFREELLQCVLKDTHSYPVSLALQEIFERFQRNQGHGISSATFLDWLSKSGSMSEFTPAGVCGALLSLIRQERCTPEMFSGQIKKEFTCTGCQNPHYTKDSKDFTHLTLEVPEKSSFSSLSLLGSYFRTMASGDRYKSDCQNCKKPLDKTPRMYLKVSPEFLVLAIANNQDLGNSPATRELPIITCSPQIDLSKFGIAEQSGSSTYNIKVVIVQCKPLHNVHNGEQYECYELHKNTQGTNATQWTPFQQESSGHTTTQTGHKSNEVPVMLIYEKIHGRNDPMQSKLKMNTATSPSMNGVHNIAKQRKTGLSNLGNTCYMNSVIQALFMCKGFQEAVLDSQLDQQITRELKNLFSVLKQSQETSLFPTEFLQVSRPKWFTIGCQHDSSEYLRHLLDKLSEEGMEGGVAESFTGKLTRKITCMSCERNNMGHIEKFTDLMLHIPKKRSTYSACELLDHHLASSPLEGDYLCEDCSELGQASLTMELKELPQFLTLTILRFQHGYGYGKVMTEVTCDPEIEVLIAEELGFNSVKYTLNAVIVHCGYSSSSGHYKCYAREPIDESTTCYKQDESDPSKLQSDEQQWYCFNDSVVSSVKNPKFHSGSMTPVILIYERQPKIPAVKAPRTQSSKNTAKLLSARHNSSQVTNRSNRAPKEQIVKETIQLLNTK